MNAQSLKAEDVLEIFLPAHDSCIWLSQDVVVMDRYVYLVYSILNISRENSKRFTNVRKIPKSLAEWL